MAATVSEISLESEGNVKWSHDILSCLNEMRRQNLLCDMYLMSNDDAIVPVHSCVMAAGSSVMYDLLCHKTDPTTEKIIIKVDGLTSERTLLNISDYLYTGALSAQIQDFNELCTAADYLNIKGFRAQCEEYLQNLHATTKHSIAAEQNTLPHYEDGGLYTLVLAETDQEAEAVVTDGGGSIGSDRPTDGQENYIEHVFMDAIQWNTESMEHNTGSTMILEANVASSEQRQMVSHESRMDPPLLLTQAVNIETIRPRRRNGNVQCEVCKKAFGTVKLKNAHVRRIHKKKEWRFGCTQCHLTFTTVHSLRNHEKRHGTKSFSCNFCQKTFYTKGECKIHQQSHMGIKPYACQFCDEKFSQQPLLLEHQLNQHLEHMPPDTVGKAVSCAVCSKFFLKLISLARHEMTCSKYRKTFQCSRCPDIFYHLSELKNHMRSVHNDQHIRLPTELHQIRYTCDKCNFSTFERARYINHCDSRHRGVKRFACMHPGCSYQAYYKCSLQKHTEKHVQQRKSHRQKGTDVLSTTTPNSEGGYMCALCGSLFKNGKALYVHEMCVHRIDKNGGNVKERMNCEVCGAMVVSEIALMNHMAKKHMDASDPAQRMTCLQCKKCFKYPSQLRSHIKMQHERQRRFNCQLCKFNAYFFCYLETHYKSVHPDAVLPTRVESLIPCKVTDHKSSPAKVDVNTEDSAFVCHLCNKGFSLECRLKNHMSIQHSNDKRFQCTQCYYQSYFYSGVKLHYEKIHNRDNVPSEEVCRINKVSRKSDQYQVYSCQQCQQEFSHKSFLKQHFQNEHRVMGRFKCPVCLYTAYYLGEMKRHYQQRHPSRAIPPEDELHIADTILDTTTGEFIGSELEIEVPRRNKLSGLYVCTLCELSFPLPCRLGKHMSLMHSGEERFVCPECGKGSYFLSWVKNHFTTHHKGLQLPRDEMFEKLQQTSAAPPSPHEAVVLEQHQCPACTNSFITFGQLQQHLSTTHANKMIFQCPSCSVQTQHFSVIRRHFTARHPGDPIPRREDCLLHGAAEELDTSNEGYSSLTTVETPLGEKKLYPCDQCSMMFDSLDQHRKHKALVHSAEIRFKLSGDKVTETEKTFTCQQCQLEFNHKTALRQHVLNKHRKKSLFKCPICAFPTYFLSEVKTHFTQHHPTHAVPKDERFTITAGTALDPATGEFLELECNASQYSKLTDLYVCTLCEVSFDLPCRLDKHMSIKHSNEVRFLCPQCQRSSYFLSWVKGHFLKQHRGIPLPSDEEFKINKLT